MMCVCVPLGQPPLSRVAVVSGGGADQDLSNLKVKVRSEVVQRGRQTQVKILRPPACFTAEEKEVGSTLMNAVIFRIFFISFKS